MASAAKPPLVALVSLFWTAKRKVGRTLLNMKEARPEEEEAAKEKDENVFSKRHDVSKISKMSQATYLQHLKELDSKENRRALVDTLTMSQRHLAAD